MTRLLRALCALTEAEFTALLTSAGVVLGLALVPMAIVLMELV